jgi:predicted RNA binding protein YcfA (HicA-like mRNA interferase family)
VKVRDVIRLLKHNGWAWKTTRGSHQQYTHPELPGKVTVPGHPNDDLAKGTEISIMKQAGLR